MIKGMTASFKWLKIISLFTLFSGVQRKVPGLQKTYQVQEKEKLRSKIQEDICARVSMNHLKHLTIKIGIYFER